MIPLFKVAMNPEADKAVAKVLQSGFIGQGEVVDKFELDLYSQSWWKENIKIWLEKIEVSELDSQKILPINKRLRQKENIDWGRYKSSSG